MPVISWDTTAWGTDASVSIFGNDELGLITVITGSALPAVPSGFLFRVYQDSFYNLVSSKVFAVVSPANKAAQDLSALNLAASVIPNLLTFRITNSGLQLTPNTTYLWVYHMPKH